MSSSDAGSDTQAETEAAPEVQPDPLREAVVELVASELGDALLESSVASGDDLWIRVERSAWVETGLALRDRAGFAFFDFLSAIDWLPSPFGRDMDAEQDWPASGPPAKDSEAMEQGVAGGATRFQVIARVLSITEHLGITIKTDLPDDDLTLATWIPVYAGANWHEREAWEMFGITFDGHPDLRKLYLPTEFEGYPMRKDFPLLARRVKPWPGIVDVELMPGEEDG